MSSLHLPLLLGDGKDANFVLLFLNNYELRQEAASLDLLDLSPFKTTP